MSRVVGFHHKGECTPSIEDSPISYEPEKASWEYILVQKHSLDQKPDFCTN